MERAKAAFLSRPLLFLLPLQAALLLPRLGLLPVWGDEQFTLRVIGLPWGEIPGALARDIHPPLYFFAVKAWAAIGADPLLAARGFSVLGLLAATVLLDRLFLRRLESEARLCFLLLWCLSPALLLYGRMARSYSWQVVAVTAASWAAERAMRNPSALRAGTFGGLSAVALYIHYLAGLTALAGGTAALLIEGVRRKNRSYASAAGISTSVCALAYAPWIHVLAEGVSRAATKDVHRISENPPLEAAVRLAYWFVSFAFGEALPEVGLAVAGVVAIPAGWLLIIGFRSAPRFQWTLGVAAVIAFAGTWRWTSFAFTPARALFLLPAFLGLLAVGARRAGRTGRVVTAALVATSLLGAGNYYGRAGFLNKGYLIPFEEIATVVTAPSDALIVIDHVDTDASPLVASLSEERGRVAAIRNRADLRRIRRRLVNSTPQHIWLLSRNELFNRFLGRHYKRVRTERRLPFPAWERRLYSALSGRPAPSHRYEAVLYERSGSAITE